MAAAGKRRSQLGGQWAWQTRQVQLGLDLSTGSPLPSLPRAGESRRVSGSASSKSNNKSVCEVHGEVEAHGQYEVHGGWGGVIEVPQAKLGAGSASIKYK